MPPAPLYLLGPGTTTRAIVEALGQPKTLLGVDAVRDRKLVGVDLSEAQIVALLDRYGGGEPDGPAPQARIVITVIGGQGHIFGRGNQQLSPRVIRRVGTDHVIVVATQTKLLSLGGGPLLVDTGDPALDAELIALQHAWLKALGIEATLLLNSIGDRACRPAYLERLEAWLDEHSSELDAEARHKRETSPLRVFDTKNPELAALLEGAPTIGDALCAECREHFEAVKTFLDACGVAYEVAPRLVRGLDYYTRTAFEFVAPGLGAQDAGSAGGRYDYLVETIGGPPTPAVGFASGIERIVLSAGESEVGKDGTDAFLIAAEGADRVLMVKILEELRENGLAADMDYASRSTKGQLTQGQRLGARCLVSFYSKSALLECVGSGKYRGEPVTPFDEIVKNVLAGPRGDLL